MRRNTKRLLACLLSACLLCVYAGGALAAANPRPTPRRALPAAPATAYDIDAVAEFCSAWNDAFSQMDVYQSLDAFGDEDLIYYLGTYGTQQGLQAQAQLVDILASPDASIPYYLMYYADADEVMLSVDERNLSARPVHISMLAVGASASVEFEYYTGEDSASYCAVFAMEDFSGIIGAAMRMENIHVTITTSEGVTSLRVNSEEAPGLNNLLCMMGAGLMYGRNGGEDYRNAEMLPDALLSEPEEPTAAPSPTPKVTVTPKPTRKPTATPKPTATLRPTATPKPAADAQPKVTPKVAVDMLKPKLSAKPKPNVSIKPVITSKPGGSVPSDLAGRTFNLEDEGPRIEKLKDRLKELGYYTEKAKYDDVFNAGMAERVMEFQENNGMYPTGAIDPKTLEMMYAANQIKGEHYTGVNVEPSITLIIPMGSVFNYKLEDGYVMSGQIHVKNISQSRTVVGYELTITAYDEDGRVMESRAVNNSGTVKPGKKAISSFFDLQESMDIRRVQVGISRIQYSDGETLTISNPDMTSWKFD